MKKGVLLLLVLLSLTVSAHAAKLPGGLKSALPNAAEDLIESRDYSGTSSLGSGILSIFEKAGSKIQSTLRKQMRDAVAILLVVLLCCAADGFYQGAGSPTVWNLMPMAGALSISLLTAGSLESLMGLGVETIDQLSTFSKVLLPTLAAAVAAGGAVGTATVQQVTTVFFVDLLISLINRLLVPLVYLYIGALTAGAMLPANRLGAIASALKKVITWTLSTALIVFTFYLSVVHIISGSADGTAVKAAKAAISGAVPIVGSILSEASETVMAGAGMLKNTIGIFGTLAILAVIVVPFIRIGIQYLLYKFTAFLAGTIGTPELSGLINGLGGAFGLILGMAGSCALLILISVLSSVAAVVP
jgi:stage III sporulation protein AE